MNPLEKFLERIRSVMQRAGAAKAPVIAAIKNVTSVDLAEKDITIRGTTVHVNASMLVKNEIFIRKGRILEELRQNNSPITDIR